VNFICSTEYIFCYYIFVLQHDRMSAIKTVLASKARSINQYKSCKKQDSEMLCKLLISVISALKYVRLNKYMFCYCILGLQHKGISSIQGC